MPELQTWIPTAPAFPRRSSGSRRSPAGRRSPPNRAARTRRSVGDILTEIDESTSVLRDTGGLRLHERPHSGRRPAAPARRLSAGNRWRYLSQRTHVCPRRERDGRQRQYGWLRRWRDWTDRRPGAERTHGRRGGVGGARPGPGLGLRLPDERLTRAELARSAARGKLARSAPATRANASVEAHRATTQSVRVPSVTVFRRGTKRRLRSKRIAADLMTPLTW